MQSGLTSSKELAQQSLPFLNELEDWQTNLPTLALDAAFPHPSQAALISVDIIRGFCNAGPLASTRVASIVDPIVRLMGLVWQHGVRNILLTQDTHEPDAVEFANFPPHCVRGTTEAETVSEIQALPFFEHMTLFEKNSIASGLNTGLNAWLAEHPQVNTFVVVGDCTDLCTYQLAMHLRLDANARQLDRRVIVPANCVQTYDIPVEVARQQGILAHPGDFLHAVFLYHMQINGIEVCAQIQ